MSYALNLEWFEDTEFVFNVINSEDGYDSWNDETVWKTAYGDYQVYVFPIRSNKKIVGYGFDITPLEATVKGELNAYNSFINEEKVSLYHSEDKAIQVAEKYLKENIE